MGVQQAMALKDYLGDQFLGILASRQPTGIVHPMGMVHPTFKLSAPARDPLPPPAGI